MRKLKSFNIVLLVLLIVCMTSILFTGCQSKNSGNAQQDNAPAGQANNGGQNQQQRKEQIQENIKALVTDGTINQSQADKIVETLTTNTFRGNGGGRQQNGGQNDTQNSGQGSTQNNGQANNQSNGQNSNQGNAQSNPQGNGQNRQFNNPLSKLVTDKVITQAQADAVMKKVMGNFQRPQGGQTGQGNQGSQNNQNGQNNSTNTK